jgi:hypothetical protein
MSEVKDQRLLNLKCDVCGKPATRWFGSTSATMCDSQECYRKHQQSYNRALEDLEAE